MKEDWFDKTVDKAYNKKQEYDNFDKFVKEKYKKERVYRILNEDYEYYQDDNAFSFLSNRIVPILVIVIIISIYFFGYKPTYTDPIENIKKVYIIFQIVFVILFFACRLIIEYKAKSQEEVLKKLKIMLIVQCIVLLIFGVILLVFDNIYNSQKFEEFYENINEEEKNRINLASSFSVQEIVNSKQAYIDENIQAYNFFKIKALLMIAIYLLCILWNVFRMYKITNMMQKHKEIKTNDKVLYDDKTEVTTGGYMNFEEYKKMKESEQNK